MNITSGNLKVSPVGCILLGVLAIIFLPVLITVLVVLLVVGIICRIFGIKTAGKGFARKFSERYSAIKNADAENRSGNSVPASEDVIDVEAVAATTEDSGSNR